MFEVCSGLQKDQDGVALSRLLAGLQADVAETRGKDDAYQFCTVKSESERVRLSDASALQIVGKRRRQFKVLPAIKLAMTLCSACIFEYQRRR